MEYPINITLLRRHEAVEEVVKVPNGYRLKLAEGWKEGRNHGTEMEEAKMSLLLERFREDVEKITTIKIATPWQATLF